MKPTIIIVAFFLAIHGYAQQYTLQTTVENYNSISGMNPTNLTPSDTIILPVIGGGIFEIPMYATIPIGFDFVIDNEVFDSIKLSQDGFAQFKNLDTNRYWISIFDCDLSDTNSGYNSEVLYMVEGNVGNRILKIEYSNFGFTEDPENDDMINCQLWLYENCSDFEIRIGSNSINSDVFWNNEPNAYMVLGNYITNYKSSLIGNPNAPTLTYSPQIQTMQGVPSNGMVYRFSNCTAKVPTHTVDGVIIFPNPASDQVTVRSLSNDINEFSLVNSVGKTIRVFSENLDEEIVISLDGLDSGIYFVIYESEHGEVATQIVKM